MKPEKYRGVANPELAKAMHALRSSGAAGLHDNRPRRERSRQDQLRASVLRSRDEQ